MFKLTKILSSGRNVPETQILKKSQKSIVQGEVLVLSSGELVACDATTVPTHIALADATAEQTELAAAQITDGMIFECPVLSGTPTSLVVGEAVCLVLSDGSAVGVNTTTTSGVALVYDTNGAAAAGDRILVQFK